MSQGPVSQKQVAERSFTVVEDELCSLSQWMYENSELGMDCGDAVNHKPEFAARTVEPGGESALRDGALGMASTVIDMAEQDVWDRLRA